MRARIHLISFLLIAANLLSGCGTLSVGIQTTPEAITPTTAPAVTEPPVVETATAEPLPLTPTTTAPASGAWIEMRDDSGFGFAVPCWWVVNAPPPGGIIRTVTVHSYDEAYFQANSIKGEWIGGTFPPGAVKLDLTMVTGIDPALGNVDAARKALTSDESEVTFTEERTVGAHQAVLVDVASRTNPSDPQTLYVFRPAPDRLLVAAAFPETAYVSSDVKGILESLALTKEEDVTLPDFAPSDPIIAVPEGCKSGQ